MALVLIVEDEVLLGKTFQASLAEDGHSVHWVPSAEEAQEWLVDHQVDLALVDVRLPGIDGIELLRHDAAHVLAEAVKELWPETQVTIGPAIENGFYYDFALE